MKLVLASLLGLVAACDASYGGFLGSVPVKDTNGNTPVQVYLGIDGVSVAAFEGARSQGAFAGWHDTQLVANFPAVSDYAWMRMLRAGSMHGYDLQYFDRKANRLVNEGLSGVLEHPLRGGLYDPLPVYRRFDFMGDGASWMVNGYADPEAALPTTLDEMFTLLATRGRQKSVLLAYLMNVDAVSHQGGLPKAIQMLVEIDRRIAEFQERHPGRYLFTFFTDHGNAHQQAELVDPKALLRQVGIDPVDALDESATQIQAVAIVHVRVNFVALHTRMQDVQAVAERSSTHRWVDLSLAPMDRLKSGGNDWRRFGIWRRGQRHAFSRATDGRIRIEAPHTWQWLVPTWPVTAPLDVEVLELSRDEAFAATIKGQYPDLFARVATAFTDPTVTEPADVLLSMPDNVTSFGFHLPGTGDHLAVDGFHGAMTRGSSMGVLASQRHTFTGPVRADDLLDLLIPLRDQLAMSK
jgi:Type I phosphodiesterase / nucleotide pyrophosphatase